MIDTSATIVALVSILSDLLIRSYIYNIADVDELTCHIACNAHCYCSSSEPQYFLYTRLGLFLYYVIDNFRHVDVLRHDDTPWLNVYTIKIIYISKNTIDSIKVK